MALDDVRDMLSSQNVPSDFGNADTLLFLTRRITHVCTPTFIVLDGASALLWNARIRRRSLRRRAKRRQGY